MANIAWRETIHVFNARPVILVEIARVYQDHVILVGAYVV